LISEEKEKNMDFISGLQWGTGLVLAFCGGGVAWLFLKPAVYRLLGITEILSENRQFNRDTLEALMQRNRLTEVTNLQLRHIANSVRDGLISLDNQK
jgi:hypothetical protein